MLEARLAQANVLKKILEAIKDLVTEANFVCNQTGISLQAMDSSHVSLVAMNLLADGFQNYRCDRGISLGISLAAMSKILKCAGNDDVCTISAADDSDTATFMFEETKHERISTFNLKLMDIDSEHLGIPEEDYEATVTMPSGEFQRICRDLSALGDSVVITLSKAGITFSTEGESGSGKIHLNQTSSVDDQKQQYVVSVSTQEEVSLKFALRYLIAFTKATPLSDQVSINMSKEDPLIVAYKISELGSVKYYLAPKIEEFDEMNEDVKA